MEKNQNAPGWVLTIESMEGIQSVQTYATKKEAIEALKQVTKDIETYDCTEQYGNCEAAQATEDYTVYVVQKPEDAVSLVNKVAWTLNQRVLFESDAESSYQWTKVFANKFRASTYYKVFLNSYLRQAEENPAIEFKYEDDGLRTLISKDGKPIVDLFCEAILIDENRPLRVVVLNEE